METIPELVNVEVPLEVTAKLVVVAEVVVASVAVIAPAFICPESPRFPVEWK